MTTETPRPRDGDTTDVRTRHLFDLDLIDDVDHERTIARLLAPQPEDDRLPLVSTPNVDDIVQFSAPRNADVWRMVRSARYVIPDGQPLVWTSRLAGEPLTARLTGSSLFPLLWRRLADTGRPTLVITSSDEVAAGLHAEYPAAVTMVAPMFAASDDAAIRAFADRVVEQARSTAAEFVLVGIGSPKQQRIALRCFDEFERLGLTAPVFLLLGASFSMHLGLVARAPAWMQRSGLEWFHRFVREPRRLFRRYFITDVKFLPMMIREVRSVRRRRTSAPAGR